MTRSSGALSHCWLWANKAEVIPSRRTNKRQSGYDAVLYMARHVIENCFAKLKEYRAIATASNFLGAIHLAAAVIWMVW